MSSNPVGWALSGLGRIGLLVNFDEGPIHPSIYDRIDEQYPEPPDIPPIFLQVLLAAK